MCVLSPLERLLAVVHDYAMKRLCAAEISDQVSFTTYGCKQGEIASQHLYALSSSLVSTAWSLSAFLVQGPCRTLLL